MPARGGLLIRSYPRGHPDSFRPVRDLGRLGVCCPCQSGEAEGRSSVWLPAWLPTAHGAWHRDPLVLVTTSGPSGDVTAADQTPPRTRSLPNPVTDGFGQARLGVYMNHAAVRRWLPCGHRRA